VQQQNNKYTKIVKTGNDSSGIS